MTLQRAGADTFVIVAIQELAEQAINKAFDIGWPPVRYVTGVSQSISSTLTPAGREKLKDAITAVYDKDRNRSHPLLTYAVAGMAGVAAAARAAAMRSRA